MTTGWPHRALLKLVLSVSPINSCDFPIFFRTNLQHFRRIYENKLKDPVLKCLWISIYVYLCISMYIYGYLCISMDIYGYLWNVGNSMDLWTTPFLDPASGRSTGGPVMRRAAGLGLALSALVVLQLEVLCILLQILYIYRYIIVEYIYNTITTITITYTVI